MKKIIFLLLPIFIVGQIFAQTSLNGKVTDAETGEALPFANVVLYKDSNLVTGAQTDFDGFFEMKNISPGDYKIEASYSGYSTSERQKITSGTEDISVLDFHLSPGILLDEVAVIGCRFRLCGYTTSCRGIVTPEEEIEEIPEPIEEEKTPEPKQIFEVKTFPNPVSNLLTIEFSDESPKSIFLTNSSGVLMKKEVIKNQQHQINVSQFEQGTYFLKIENGKQSRTEKVIIVR